MEMIFAQRLRNLRNEFGLKQEQLAVALHTTQRRISYWETGKIEPDLKTLCMLAEYFNVSTDYLLGLKDF